MKELKDIYNMLIKEYPDWGITYHDDYIEIKKDNVIINADSSIVNITIHKGINSVFDHAHYDNENNTLKDIYNKIVYYIENKDILLEKETKSNTKWKIILITITILIIILIVLTK